MAKREWLLHTRCKQDGCREFEITSHGIKADRDEWYVFRQRKPWYCNRHREGNIRPGHESGRQVLVATRVRNKLRPDEWLDGLFWVDEANPEGASKSGFTFGFAFNSYASDFAEGTRLVIEVRAEPPGGTDEPAV